MVKVSKRDTCDRYYLLKFLGFGIFLHRLHKTEDYELFHNHPWSWFSIIFFSYVEEVYGKKSKTVRFFNWHKGDTFHRIIIPYGREHVWTLFFHSRRFNKWQVKNREGKIIDEEPWRGVEGERTTYRPE